jgi:hypothetical protein
VCSFCLKNAPRIIFKLVKSRFKNLSQFKQGASRCRRGLDFIILLNSALKIITLYWQITVFSMRIATEKIAVPQIAIVRGPNLRAECQRPEPPAGFILGLRAGVGNPQNN